MRELTYTTGYAADDYQADEFFAISRILNMELLLLREQRINNYHIPPMTISQLRMIDTSSDIISQMCGYCNDIMNFLKIGEVYDGGHKDELLLRYSTGEDAKVLDKMIQELDKNSYGEEIYFIFNFENYPHLSDKKKEELTAVMIKTVNDAALHLECCMEERNFNFSDGTTIITLAQQVTYEANYALVEFLGGFAKLYDALIRKKESQQ